MAGNLKNLHSWPKGVSGNLRGRPKSGRGAGVWSEKTAIRAFQAATTDAQRQAVTKAVLEIATGPRPPWWALKAVSDAAGLDGEYLRRTGHLPKPKVFVWA